MLHPVLAHLRPCHGGFAGPGAERSKAIHEREGFRVDLLLEPVAGGGAIQAFHNSRMLRYNAVRLWQNLLRQGWSQVPPQW